MTKNENLLTIESLKELASVHQPPCLSLYQPTHRRPPENRQDPIRFRNLVKELEASLQQKYPAAESRLLLEPFEALAHDGDFWNHTSQGLAVLADRDHFRVFRLQRPVVALAVVADSFHTKPLRHLLQSSDGYQVLGLSLDKIHLFEGNRDALYKIDPAPGVPRTIAEALGDELTEPHLTVASYGGTGQGTSPMRHGDGGRPDQEQADEERFFRAVDRAVHEHHSVISGLPLILAALPEHQYLFRHVSHNPFLSVEGLKINPEVVPIDELRDLAWQAVEPQYKARLTVLADEFAVAKANGLGGDDLKLVAHAAAAGRVATLLIESDRMIAGRLDAATGEIEVTDLSDPQVDDLLDDLGELVSKMGGRVMVMPAESMSAGTGLAAIYRY
jgi:hypothetical protein